MTDTGNGQVTHEPDSEASVAESEVERKKQETALRDDFHRAFRDEQQAIREVSDALVGGGAESQVHEQLDALLTRVRALETKYTRSTHLLAPFDQQKCRETIRQLEAEISKRREQLAPRKKFAFRRKAPPPKSDTSGYAEPPVAASDSTPAVSSTDAKSSQPLGENAATFQGELFEGLNGVLVAKGAGEVAGRDVTLRTLQGCRIVILDRIGALHCHGLRECEIIIGAVGSSALLYGCKDCSLTLAGKQLRLHDSERIALHLHTLSGPVIEHCKRILLSPYDIWYPDVESHWSSTGLGSTTAARAGASTDTSGPWADMQDFDWHRRQASPNWRLVPVDLRRPRRDMENLEYASRECSATLGNVPPSLELLFDRCRGLWNTDDGPRETAAEHTREASSATTAVAVAQVQPTSASGIASGDAAPHRLGDDEEF